MASNFPLWPTRSDFDDFLKLILSSEKHPFLEHEELFNFYAKSAVLTADNSNTPIIFVSGLGACTIAWRLSAGLLHKDKDTTVHCVTLAGHDGSWESVQNTTPELWLTGLKEYIEQHQLKGAVCISHSSGTLPSLLLENQFPGTFSKIIAVGAPFFLAAPFFNTRVTIARLLDKISKIFCSKDNSYLRNLKIAAGKSLAELQDPVERVNVTYSYMPGTVFSTLKTCIQQCKKILPLLPVEKIHFIQGELDLVVESERCQSYLKSLGYELEIIKGAPHAAHVSPQWELLFEKLRAII